VVYQAITGIPIEGVWNPYSYPGLKWLCPLNSLLTPFVVLVVAVCYLSHVKIFLID